MTRARFIRRWVFAAVVIAASVPLALLAHRAAGLSLVLGGWRDVLVFLVLAPFLEEWVFRQGIQSFLHQRWRAAHSANLATSVLFALAHAPTAGAWAVLWLVPSLALGEIWRQHRRLWLNTVVHIWFNACLWWACI